MFTWLRNLFKKKQPTQPTYTQPRTSMGRIVPPAPRPAMAHKRTTQAYRPISKQTGKSTAARREETPSRRDDDTFSFPSFSSPSYSPPSPSYEPSPSFSGGGGSFDGGGASGSWDSGSSSSSDSGSSSSMD